MGDLGESLIDVTQGHGGQGLINLLITGRASPYVWDDIKNVGGLGKQGQSYIVMLVLPALLEESLTHQMSNT